RLVLENEEEDWKPTEASRRSRKILDKKFYRQLREKYAVPADLAKESLIGLFFEIVEATTRRPGGFRPGGGPLKNAKVAFDRKTLTAKMECPRYPGQHHSWWQCENTNKGADLQRGGERSREPGPCERVSHSTASRWCWTTEACYRSSGVTCSKYMGFSVGHDGGGDEDNDSDLGDDDAVASFTHATLCMQVEPGVGTQPPQHPMAFSHALNGQRSMVVPRTFAYIEEAAVRMLSAQEFVAQQGRASRRVAALFPPRCHLRVSLGWTSWVASWCLRVQAGTRAASRPYRRFATAATGEDGCEADKQEVVPVPDIPARRQYLLGLRDVGHRRSEQASGSIYRTVAHDGINCAIPKLD
ncbi:hypothetical protein CYMTET_49933, partial [Cymbomonas tetramitiformis]